MFFEGTTIRPLCVGVNVQYLMHGKARLFVPPWCYPRFLMYRLYTCICHTVFCVSFPVPSSDVGAHPQTFGVRLHLLLCPRDAGMEMTKWNNIFMYLHLWWYGRPVGIQRFWRQKLMTVCRRRNSAQQLVACAGSFLLACPTMKKLALFCARAWIMQLDHSKLSVAPETEGLVCERETDARVCTMVNG